MSKSPTVIVALSGIALGVVIGAFVRPATRERSGGEPRVAERHDGPLDAAAPRPEPAPDAPKDRTFDAVRAEDPAKATSTAFEAELARRSRDGIRSGWSDVRRDKIPETLLDTAVAGFKEEVARRPEEIGRALATNQTKQEQAAELGPAFLALERLHQGEALPPGLVADPEQFNALFERRAAEIPIDGVKALDDLKSNLTDGATLQFPAGVFRVDLASALRTLDLKTRALPSDLTVAGAGIDATLLVSGEITLVSAIRNWTFRDCTIFTEGPLVDSRKDSVLTIDRVRLTGFDTGAGGSSAFDLTGNVLRCRDSIIDGSYGNSPGGNLMDVRSDAMLARFERCRLGCLFIGWARDSWSIAFDDCQFTDYLTHGDPRQPKLAKGMTTTDCTFTLFDDSKGEPPRKSLDPLFPNWEKILRR
jgi:hypothetical protein